MYNSMLFHVFCLHGISFSSVVPLQLSISLHHLQFPSYFSKSIPFPHNCTLNGKKEGNAIPVRGRGGPYGCETSRPQRLSRPQGHSAAGRIRLTEKSNDLIGNLTRELPAYSIVPQPTTLSRDPTYSP
jgi:hypothetical protein